MKRKIQDWTGPNLYYMLRWASVLLCSPPFKSCRSWSVFVNGSLLSNSPRLLQQMRPEQTTSIAVLPIHFRYRQDTTNQNDGINLTPIFAVFKATLYKRVLQFCFHLPFRTDLLDRRVMDASISACGKSDQWQAALHLWQLSPGFSSHLGVDVTYSTIFVDLGMNVSEQFVNKSGFGELFRYPTTGSSLNWGQDDLQYWLGLVWNDRASW